MTHLFVSDTDGALYDTREANWFSRTPLRVNYQRTFQQIDSLSKLKATLRNGPYAWPGGYPIVLYLEDGEPCTFQAVRDDWRRVVSDMMAGCGQFNVVAADIYYEGPALACAMSGQLIESAYGDPDEMELESALTMQAR
jgi:hypothetical protein